MCGCCFFAFEVFQCAWNTSNEEEEEFRSHCSSSCRSLTRADKGAVHTLQCGGGGGGGVQIFEGDSISSRLSQSSWPSG